MPQSNEHQQATAQKPNWVDIGTFCVLSLTLIAVVYYTCEAHRQNQLTQKIIRMNARASIGGVWYSDHLIPQIRQKLNIPLGLINWGQPIVANVTTVATYKLDKIAEPSMSAAQPISKFVWPRPVQNIFDTYTDETITDTQLGDMRAGRGWLFLETEITYGPYVTKMCTGLPLQPSSQDGPLRSGLAELCAAPRSNCVDEECKQQ